MYYRLAGGNRTHQFFPGENGNGHDGLASGSSISPWMIPADYYAEPENYGFPLDPSPWTCTEERRATLALYDYRSTDSLVMLTDVTS